MIDLRTSQLSPIAAGFVLAVVMPVIQSVPPPGPVCEAVGALSPAVGTLSPVGLLSPAVGTVSRVVGGLSPAVGRLSPVVGEVSRSTTCPT